MDILTGVESDTGVSATYLASISLVGSYNSSRTIVGRVTTSSGGGVSTWRYVDVGDHACTAILSCYGYLTTSHTETGAMIAIPL